MSNSNTIPIQMPSKGLCVRIINNSHLIKQMPSKGTRKVIHCTSHLIKLSHTIPIQMPSKGANKVIKPNMRVLVLLPTIPIQMPTKMKFNIPPRCPAWCSLSMSSLVFLDILTPHIAQSGNTWCSCWTPVVFTGGQSYITTATFIVLYNGSY